MKTLHIINKAAGGGDVRKALAKLPPREEIYTAGSYDEAFMKLPFLSSGEMTEVFVFGGDGMLNRAVSDIMRCGTGKSSVIYPVPTGSANDFYKLIHEKSDGGAETFPCDVMKVTGLGRDIYGINELNIGFDCGVVANAEKYKRKPFVTGKFSYILGIAEEFTRKRTTEMNISLAGSNENTAGINGKFLLFCVANGKYYGGGFAAAPLANLDDGKFDVVLVDDISRMKFVSLVGAYKKGAHMDAETMGVRKKFSGLMRYFRSGKIVLTGADRICVDGEIYPSAGKTITIENLHRATIVGDAFFGA
ncbi:MAG: hypothetical protein LUD44_01165 [Firmicutes bacterium]|nr:hypothetical protein [Bacillota bacterium]